MRFGKKTRLLTALLALLMLFGTLMMTVSCAVVDEGEEESESKETTEKGDNEYDNLPKKNYNRDLKVISLTDKITDFLPDEDQKGETLTDALLTRNSRLESDFGVTVTVHDGGDYEAMKQELMKEQSNREDAFDIYVNQLYAFTGNVLQNHAMDLNMLENVDLDGEWWDQACRETLIMDGRNFMMTGDISPDAMLISACMVFNKRMMADLKKEEPYDLVENDEWTLDVLYNYIDGVTNENLNRYGLTCWSLDVPYSLFYGCGETFVKVDDDTGSHVVEYDNSKVIEIYDKMYNIIVTAKSNFVQLDLSNPSNTPDKAAYDTFSAGNALFADITLSKISEYITSMKDDYGIVPMPKYDKTQEDYQTFVNGAAAHMLVSSTEKDTEFVGKMLEAMATYNYEYVTPQLYEVVAKSKDARDPESADMVDIIIRNRVYDFAYWTKEKLVIADVISNELVKKNAYLTTPLTSARSKSVSALQKLMLDWEKVLSKTGK